MFPLVTLHQTPWQWPSWAVISWRYTTIVEISHLRVQTWFASTIAFIWVFPISWQYHLLGSFPSGEFSPYRKHILPWIPAHDRLSLYPRKSTCLALPQQWEHTAQNTAGFFCIPEMALFRDFPTQSTRHNFQNSKSGYFHGVFFPPRGTFLVFTIFFFTLCPFGGTGMDRLTNIRHLANVLHFQEYRVRRFS